MKFLLGLFFLVFHICTPTYAQSVNAKILRFNPVTSLPSICKDGDMQSLTSDGKIYFCLSNTWYQLNGTTGGGLTADEVVITDGSGNLTTEATLAKIRGGTGADNSAVTFPTTGTVVTEAGTAALLNKTLAVDQNTVTTAASGNLTSTELNAALSELQTDIDTRALDSALTTHISDTTTHGTTGDIVGTSDAQTLTNKTINADNNTVSNLAHGAEVDNPSSGVHGVTGSVVGTTDTQTLSGKSFSDAVDITAGPLTVGGTTPDAASLFEVQSTTQGSIPFPKMTEAQRDAISSPPSGLCVYNTDTANVNCYDGATWGELAGGGGAGGITYWEDFQADTIANVEEDSDGPNYAGTPDASATNLSTSLETTNPLSGDNSYNLVKGTADASDQAFILQASTPDRLSTTGGETVFITFNYETDANYDNSSSGNQFAVYTYANDSGLQACNTRDVLSGSFTNNMPAAPDGGQWQCTRSLTSADTELDVLIQVVGTGTTATTMIIDRIVFGPSATVTAPIVTEYISTDCTGTHTANVAYTCFYRRVGDEMEVKADLNYSGSTTAANLVLTVPEGLSMDTSKMASGSFSNIQPVGYGTFLDSGVTVYEILVGRSSSDTTLQVYYKPTATSYAVFSNSAPVSIVSGDRMSIHYRIPITEWSQSNAVLSTTQADQAVQKAIVRTSSTTSLSNGVTTQIVNFAALEDTHGLVDAGDDEIDLLPNTCYFLAGQVRLSTTTSGNVLFQIRNSASDAIARTETAASAANSEPHLNAATLYCAGSNGDSVSIWARQASGGTETTIGSGSGVANNTFLTAYSIPNFSTFSTHGPYEVISFQSSQFNTSTAGFANGEWAQLTGNSLTLTAGTWELDGWCRWGRNGGDPGAYDGICLWAEANGNNTSTTPASIGTSGPCTIDHGGAGTQNTKYSGTGTSRWQRRDWSAAPTIITCTGSDDIYLNVLGSADNLANGALISYGTARRLK